MHTFATHRPDHKPKHTHIPLHARHFVDKTRPFEARRCYRWEILGPLFCRECDALPFISSDVIPSCRSAPMLLTLHLLFDVFTSICNSRGCHLTVSKIPRNIWHPGRVGVRSLKVDSLPWPEIKPLQHVVPSIPVLSDMYTSIRVWIRVQTQLWPFASLCTISQFLSIFSSSGLESGFKSNPLCFDICPTLSQDFLFSSATSILQFFLWVTCKHYKLLVNSPFFVHDIFPTHT